MDRLHLIAEIFSRPALWDLESEEYKTRICTNDMWKEVANIMGPNVTIDDCKRKWKNLRDAYRAEIKRIEVRIERDLLKGTYDAKADYTSKWAYFEHMKFIKDIKRPRRRKVREEINDNSEELDQFSELHDIDDIKLEPGVEPNTNTYLLQTEEKDVQVNNQICNKLAIFKEDEKQNQATTEVSLKATVAQNLSTLPPQRSPNIQRTTVDKQAAVSCKCPKRSYDQVHILEDLEKEEQSLMKSMHLDRTRVNDLAYVGDPDYNFLISFLPQIKKMNELQNLKFRAKMSDFMFNIMSNNFNHV